MGLSSVFVTIPPPSGLADRANDGWGDDRCGGKRHVAAMLAVGSAPILEIVQNGPR
jgi:hypothetical protein